MRIKGNYEKCARIELEFEERVEKVEIVTPSGKAIRTQAQADGRAIPPFYI